MKLGKIAVGASAIAIVCALAGGALATHSWNNYHWARSANPINIQVIDSVTSFWQGEFTTAIGEWGASSVINLTVTSADDSKKARRTCKLTQGKIRVCNEAYGFNGWLGLATISLDNQGHIDAGSAKMNDSYSSYWTDPNEKRHVMCQEVGHDFGLGHTSEDGSSQGTCMDYSQSPSSISPNAHDYAQLELIYAHLDSYNSNAASAIDPVIADSSAAAPEGVPAGAILVDRSARHEVWVKGRSDGGHFVYHVYLAPEGAKGR